MLYFIVYKNQMSHASIAIKNSVIFFLLIALVHTLLVRLLGDMKQRDTQYTQSNQRDTFRVQNSQDARVNSQDALESLNSQDARVQNSQDARVNSQDARVNSQSLAFQDSRDDREDEVLKYVYGDLESRDMKSDVPKFHSHDWDSMNINPSYSVISQYPNERTLNGGEVSPGILAFDQVYGQPTMV